MAESAETKKIIDDPRVEIDTSPPFESVKEAVDRFGGSGPWIPHHLLRLAAHSNEAFDVDRIEEQAFQLERDLIMKEQQTLNVLKELESAKRFVEGLKLNLMPELSSFMDSPPSPREGTSSCPGVSPSLMFTELNQAKSNLSKTSVDLAAIQASVESLNKKLKKDKILLDRRDQIIQTHNGRDHEVVPPLSIQENQRDVNRVDVSLILSKQVTFEAEQFKRMTEASRYEVMKAMAEIERTKNCIRMAEMRLNAAKKMEEAAKAVEAIAVAQRKFLSSNEIPSGSCSRQEPDGITLSFEEYKALSQRAKQGDHDHQLCKTKFIDTNGLQRSKDEPRQHHDHHHQDHLQVPILEKFEETTTTTTTNENRNRNRNRNRAVFNEDGPNHHTNVVIEDSFTTTHVEQGRVERSGNNFSMFKFRNSHAGNRSGTDDERPPPVPGFRSTTSIGDVLSRKLIVEDEVHVENHGDERKHVSLSQMLREQSRLILHPNKTTAEKQQYFIQRKKFGFIQLPIPTKQNKKKNATSN